MEPSDAPVGRAARVAAGGVVAAVVIAAWWYAARTGWSVEALQALLTARPVLAPVLFVIAHCAAAAAFLPCSPFTLAAGFLWGTALGLPISIIGALAASCFTFLVSRHLTGARRRSAIAESTRGRPLAALARLGWKGVALAQLNPVVPASTLGYLFGLTSIPLRTYALAVAVAMLPLQIALVAAGDATRAAFMGRGEALLVAGIAFAAGALYIAARVMAKRQEQR